MTVDNEGGGRMGGEVVQMRFSKGQAVRTLRSVRPERYAGREGVVERLDNGEVGVWLGAWTVEKHHKVVWFRENELAPLEATQGPRGDQ